MPKLLESKSKNEKAEMQILRNHLGFKKRNHVKYQEKNIGPRPQGTAIFIALICKTLTS